MKSSINITLRADDAEPILREAAYEAAKYGAQLDYITRKTYDGPFGGFAREYDEGHVDAQKRFARAKRIVESFGIEYEPTSEPETLTLHYPYVGGKRVNRGGMFTEIVGSKPDYDHPIPMYRREVHSLACKAAANRVVRAWRQVLKMDVAA